MWEKIEVSGAGRPTFSQNESEILVEDNIGLYEGKYKAAGYQDGRVYLTTHRLCYVDSSEPATHSIALKLCLIKGIDYSGRFLRSSPKITLHIDTSSPPTSREDTPTAKSPAPQQVTWICQICFYANALPKDYEHNVSELPVCLTCGIKATADLIQQAIANATKSEFRPPHPVTPTAASDTSIDVGGKKNNNKGFPCPRCTFLNHPLMTQCEMCGAMLISSNLPPQLANVRIDSPGPSTALTIGTGGGMVKLSFRGNGDKRFYDKLKAVLAEKPWKTASGNRKTSAPSLGPGLHGLEQVGERHKQKNEEVLESALGDLEGLMSRAKEVVKLAENYARYLEKTESSSDVNTSARRLLRESSEALGLNSSVVTKEMAHEQETFHAELARQIAEFLQNGVLAREGGIIDLVDLFAIYNRARGISLISPSDLHAACELMEKLNLPVKMRRFKSGVLVVQEAYKTPRVIIRELLNWMHNLEPWKHDVGVSVEDVCAKFGWSVTVSIEELDMAEQQGAICRDDQLSGLRYFENRILPYVPTN
uniref:Vacuolar protein-sorting-associated protein 36 n=1 Tax=Blastobotrys adeninivorans TaxID=409370 RepID=A0A060T3W0_BLAAD